MAVTLVRRMRAWLDRRLALLVLVLVLAVAGLASGGIASLAGAPAARDAVSWRAPSSARPPSANAS